jgi:hypothetical protein
MSHRKLFGYILKCLITGRAAHCLMPTPIEKVTLKNPCLPAVRDKFPAISPAAIDRTLKKDKAALALYQCLWPALPGLWPGGCWPE